MAKVKLFQYKSKVLKDGTHPIVLTLRHQNKVKKYSTGLSCTPKQWNSQIELFNKYYPKQKDKNRYIQKLLFKAEDILENMKLLGKTFTYAEFDNLYNSVPSKDVFQFFDIVIDRLKKSGNASNARVYKDVKNVFKNYLQKDKLSFLEINHTFLIDFETYKKSNGVKGNTISYYMRTLRSLFNKAIREKHCPKDIYPFNDYKIGSLSEETRKRAITLEEIKKVEAYKPELNTKEELSIHLFMFSFYTFGMNYKDMALLTWDNIVGDRIVYVRAKTKRKFTIKINERVSEILKYYQSFKVSSIYIFPILNHQVHNTPEKIRVRIKSGTKRMNVHLKKISYDIGIFPHITFYVARHSFATILKRKGASTSLISEAMGHATERTTQIYLDSFENKTLDGINDLLL